MTLFPSGYEAHELAMRQCILLWGLEKDIFRMVSAVRIPADIYRGKETTGVFFCLLTITDQLLWVVGF